MFQGVKCSSEYIKRGIAKSRQGVTLQPKVCAMSNNNHSKKRSFYENLHSDFRVPFGSIRLMEKNVWCGTRGMNNIKKEF
jgi:hypothetical protein